MRRMWPSVTALTRAELDTLLADAWILHPELDEIAQEDRITAAVDRVPEFFFELRALLKDLGRMLSP